MSEQAYMSRAISLARLGEGYVHPNPMVGAVIVKEGRIIGEGYHKRYGFPHAERNAIASLSESARGATLYVTLEPCAHYGKTPPCTEAIIEQGIAKVVIGSADPNPKVAGKGVEKLLSAGIEVVEGFMREECDALNPVFFHYITTKTPYVIMKTAQTLDGKIATKRGASKWITGEEARREVHSLRFACMAVMVGIGTVLADDPLLTCRLPGGKNPLRVICDSSLRIPLSSRVVETAGQVDTLIALSNPNYPMGEIGLKNLPPEEKMAPEETMAPEEKMAPKEKMEALLKAGVRLVNLPDEAGRVDLRSLMSYLGEAKVDSVLLEGGGTLNEAALRSGIVQEYRLFLAPKVFGGAGVSPVSGEGVDLVDEAFLFTLEEMKRVGEDVMLRYKRR